MGSDCDLVAWAETEEKLFTNAAEHGAAVHGMTSLPPEAGEMAKSLIREE